MPRILSLQVLTRSEVSRVSAFQYSIESQCSISGRWNSPCFSCDDLFAIGTMWEALKRQNPDRKYRVVDNTK